MRKVLAFDIGGTNMRCALVNEKFEVEKRIDLSTVTHDPEAFMTNCPYPDPAPTSPDRAGKRTAVPSGPPPSRMVTSP